MLYYYNLTAFFNKFLKDYDIQWRTNKFESWLAEQVSAVNTKIEAIANKLETPESVDVSGVSFANEVRQNLFRVDRLVEEFQEYKRKNLKELSESSLQEDYDNFIFKNGDKLEEEFFAMNDFRTTMRGIKVRGVFASEAEASARGKRLQKADPNFNIYMGAVGKWMAYEPDPNKVSDQEYANEQLNTLMKKYRENEENRESFYHEQKNSRIGAAKTKASADVVPEVKLTSTAFAGSSYDGLFSGPADLAIARKMEDLD